MTDFLLNSSPLSRRFQKPTRYRQPKAFWHRAGPPSSAAANRLTINTVEDFIRIPEQSSFFEPINFYRTALHELTHWTGHKSRLARDFSGRFGNEAYAREELVAELGSAFLCASLGIVPTVRHADYIGNWLTILKNDSRAIVSAASHASKASDFLLAFTHQA